MIARHRAVALASLGAIAAVLTLATGLSLARWADISGPLGDVDLGAVQRGDDLGAAMTVLALIALVLHAAAMGALFHRARKLLASVGRPIADSAGLAAACFFIPIGNLFLPPRIARSLLQATGIAGEKASRSVLTWWLPFVLGGVLGRISGVVAGDDEVGSVDRFRTGLLVQAAGQVLVVVGAVLACRVVLALAAAVEQTVAERRATLDRAPGAG